MDVVPLLEPILSGEYKAKSLLMVTNSFDISRAVHTVTRDNATPSTVMLKEFEAVAGMAEFTTEQPWTFKV